jgi:hypothetical protein
MLKEIKMKTKNLLSNKMLTAVFLAVFGMPSLFAQTDLGSSCGCPPVGSRPEINLSTLSSDQNTIVKVHKRLGNGAWDGALMLDSTIVTKSLTANNTILTCDKTWILDQKTYVGKGKTLTIEPGTLIKAQPKAIKVDATALIVQRGAKIFANGTETCPIVFTAYADGMDGTYPIKNAGMWGGVCLLGIATNNLIAADAYSAGYAGVGFVEGFAASNGSDLYGAGPGDPDPSFQTPDDDDNSGVLKYVSIRFAGTQIADANELNGLSLASVGRGTTVEHVEIISAADDNIEIFGGTVNLKYITTMFGCDDMFDWDLGWTGKAQFLFGVADPANAIGGTASTVYPGSSDNGFEADADDNKTAALTLRSHPIIYNATLISNYNDAATADNTGPAAIQAKELTQGEIYNSVFVGFKSGLHLATGRETSSGNWGDAYTNWQADTVGKGKFFVPATGHASYKSLIVKNNTFVGNTYKFSKGVLISGKNPAVSVAPTLFSAADSTQFYADGNLTPASITGTTLTWAIDVNTNAIATKLDAEPSLALASSITPPADGFFTPTTYRGAFPTLTQSWLSKWTYASLIKTSGGLQDNPTDINRDGRTNGTDLGLLLAKYGLNNQ